MLFQCVFFQISHRSVIAAAALALLSTGCGPAQGTGIEAATAAAVSEADPDTPGLLPPEPTNDPDLATVIPPADVAERVLIAASEASPESGLTLQDCTDWVADSEIVLPPEQSAQCAGMLAAAMGTCSELDCFAPATTAAPFMAAESAPAEGASAVAASMSATTAATVAPEPDEAPEGGHPPATVAGMIPRQHPYWDYPNCPGGAPWPSDCFPPSEWEAPQDLSDCWTPVPEAGVCASRQPDEIPRLTRDVVGWTNWCYAQPRGNCGWLLFEMKWSLDYLGAHPWCVLKQYVDRVNAYTALRGAPAPPDMPNRHGWHNCPSVIDPGLPQDPRRRLSQTGITLAEQCRIVLPADVELEDRPRRVSAEPERFGSDCDLWAKWVEGRPRAWDWPNCDRSARVAEEWMEHHHGTPERYFNVTC